MVPLTDLSDGTLTVPEMTRTDALVAIDAAYPDQPIVVNVGAAIREMVAAVGYKPNHLHILDSMGLVTLVVGVEQAIEDELGVSVSLADARALSQRNSPYRTVGSLANATAIGQKGLFIGNHPQLDDRRIDHIIGAFHSFFEAA